MKKQKIVINGISAVIWGNKSDRVYLFVNENLSDKGSVQSFAQIADRKGCQTVSFDLADYSEKTECKTLCNTTEEVKELGTIGEYVFDNWKSVSLYACSLGAFYSLRAYADRHFERCLFRSPIVDAEYLINKMLSWFAVSEKKTEYKKESFTPADILPWKYYQCVQENSIKKWNSPSCILYGANDRMQPIDAIKSFCGKFACKLTVAENSGHNFNGEGDNEVLNEWYERCV